MPLRLPITPNDEFRGVKPPREYTIRETGERKLASAVLKFLDMPKLSPEGEERVRVEVLLERNVLADLDAIIKYRRGRSASRSALVREACSWLLSKEAGWLLRHHAQMREGARRAAEEARSSAEREANRAAAQRDVIESALDIARGDSSHRERTKRRTGRLRDGHVTRTEGKTCKS